MGLGPKRAMGLGLMGPMGLALRAPRSFTPIGVFALATALSACSAVSHVYSQRDYDARAAHAVKRVAVVAWAPPAIKNLDTLVGRIASDVVKLRRNYLVHSTATARRDVTAACQDDAKVQGVLLWRVLDAPSTAPGMAHSTSANNVSPDAETVPSVVPPGDDAPADVHLRMAAQLLRCTDGAMLWRAEAEDTTASRDADLAQLTSAYERDLGALAERFAAPIFAIVQDLVDALPDVVLNDDEVMEKIELGASGSEPAPMVAAFAMLRPWGAPQPRAPQ